MRRDSFTPDIVGLPPLRRAGRWSRGAVVPPRAHGWPVEPTPGPVTALVAIGLIEIALAIAVALDAMPMAPALASHAAIVVALILVGHARARAGQPLDPLVLLFGVTTASLGPVGVLGTLLAALLRRRFSRHANRLDDWYAALFPGVEARPSAALYGRILHGESGAHDRSTLAPFADVMASGSVENKQAVIMLIVSHFKPAFAPALLGALNDAEPAVRVQAATAVARLENGFLRRTILFEERCRQEPEHTGVALALARHCDDYANTGLLDETRARTARLRALDLYRDCERRGVQDAQVRNSVIRLLVRLGRHSEAVDAFAPLVESGLAAPALFAWYVQCLYELGRFDLLRQSCAQFHTEGVAMTGISDPCLQALSLWAVGGGLPVQEPQP